MMHVRYLLLWQLIQLYIFFCDEFFLFCCFGLYEYMFLRSCVSLYRFYYPTVKNFICISNLADSEGPTNAEEQVKFMSILKVTYLFLIACLRHLLLGVFFLLFLLHSFLWILNFYCRSKMCVFCGRCMVHVQNILASVKIATIIILWSQQASKPEFLYINRCTRRRRKKNGE